MGRSAKDHPARLADKLQRIRKALGLSQNEMLRRLGLPEKYVQASISGYELGTRQPPLGVLLAYARTAGVWVDVLIDDDLELPGRLPPPRKSEGTKRRKKGR